MSAKSSPPSRLGRGLNSLIKVAEPVVKEIESASASQATLAPPTIAIGNIHPNPHQPRRQFNQKTLEELAESIKAAGIIQPIIVRASTADTFELIAGERRWRAAQLAGLTEIPAIVRQVDAFTQAQMALLENIQREDLNPLERAAAYQSLIDQLGLTQNELASRLGEDRSSIANYLRLLNLTLSVQDSVRQGKLSLGHAKLLAGVSDPIEQGRLADLCITRDLTVRNLENLIRSGIPSTKDRPSATSQPHNSEMEKTIGRQLGLRVQLRPSAKPGKGKLIIHYADLDQFDELLHRFNITLPQE
jgi:ParB family chromosome partitioning protein